MESITTTEIAVIVGSVFNADATEIVKLRVAVIFPAWDVLIATVSGEATLME